MLNSRSVAVIVNWLPLTSTSRFDRMGMVVLRSTTPCVVKSSFNSADFVTLNSIDWCSSRAVPGAVIVKFTFDQAWDEASVAHFYRCRTLLAFCQSIKPAAGRRSVDIGGKASSTWLGRCLKHQTQQQSTSTTNTTESFSDFRKL